MINKILTNKIALVTGGSKGIGKEITIELLNQGAKVYFTYLKNQKLADQMTEKHDKKNLISVKMDVTNRGSIKSVIKLIKRENNRLDILVNNVGINKPSDFDKITEDDWDEIINTNLKGPFMCCQESLSLLKKGYNSSIINIGSVSGQFGGPRTAHYAASKAGLISLGQVIARFSSEFNIRCNTISAGIIESEMASKSINSKKVKDLTNNILMKRLGKKEEISKVVTFLASDSSTYITAQTINVNGGLYF